MFLAANCNVFNFVPQLKLWKEIVTTLNIFEVPGPKHSLHSSLKFIQGGAALNEVEHIAKVIEKKL